jgi:integrating conjugative element protein (TIGR03756 family)
VIHPFDLLRRMRAAVASVLLLSATGSYALNTATIVGSVASPDCLEYRVVGICYWLYCTWTGCTVRTSVKVRHYIPDAVVSSYSNTGENPWVEVRAMSTPNPSAQAGGDGTTNDDHENNLAKFKNADVIGHPGGRCSTSSPRPPATSAKARARPSCRICSARWTRWPGATTSRRWFYPEALIPGMREVGTRTTPEPLGQRVSPRWLPAPDRRPQEPAPWWPSARAMSSRAAGRSTCTSHCSPTPATATGRPAR